jgi:predicted phage-related endonuclease
MPLTTEQLEMRRSGVTATDVVALAGASPYGDDAATVFAAKVGPPTTCRESPAMAAGHAIEPLALRLLADAEGFAARGLTITPGTDTLRHAIFPWLMATPDGIVVPVTGGRPVAGAEAKLVGARMMHHWGEDREVVPDWVHIQAQVQAMVLRVSTVYVTAMLGGTEHRVYEVQHDVGLAQALVEVAEAFYTRHLVPKVPPPSSDPGRARAAIEAAWPRHRAGLVSATPAAEAVARRYLEARETEKAAKAAKELAAAELAALIGEGEGVEGTGWRATWRWHEGHEVKAYRVEAGRRFDLRTVKEAKR